MSLFSVMTGKGRPSANDAVSIAAGGAKTYLGKTTGALSPNQFTFGTQTISIGRAADIAAFDLLEERFQALVAPQTRVHGGQFAHRPVADGLPIVGLVVLGNPPSLLPRLDGLLESPCPAIRDAEVGEEGRAPP